MSVSNAAASTTGVCIKLKELIGRLFPRRSKQRCAEVEQEQEREKGERSNGSKGEGARHWHVLDGAGVNSDCTSVCAALHA